MNSFLSALGTYAKALLTVVLTLILTQMANGSTILNLDWAIIGNGAVVSIIPVIINALNPNDQRYGLKKEEY